MFQHTAARRRLDDYSCMARFSNGVSTHSRPKAAGAFSFAARAMPSVSTHSRPKAAGSPKSTSRLTWWVSTHSRPKAAGIHIFPIIGMGKVSTHSRPKAAGASLKSLAPSGFAAPSSLSSQEKRVREYNTAFSVTPAFAIS